MNGCLSLAFGTDELLADDSFEVLPENIGFVLRSYIQRIDDLKTFQSFVYSIVWKIEPKD